jgi:PBP1b-binding outer membrane lipoprotein LpoB
MKTVLFAFLGIFLLAACSKTPESETAKKIGEQPKQIVDKVTTDLNKAMQKETQRQAPDPEKKE